MIANLPEDFSHEDLLDEAAPRQGLNQASYSASEHVILLSTLSRVVDKTANQCIFLHFNLDNTISHGTGYNKPGVGLFAKSD
jgi:hypothetical protein